MRNKTLYMSDYITTNNLDIVAICETWLSKGDEPYINALLPDGYGIKHFDRDDGRRGGGVALIIRESIKIIRAENLQCEQFEGMLCRLCILNFSLDVFVIYRPPQTQENGLNNTKFIDEFRELLSTHVTNPSELIILGDINLHLDIPDNTHVLKFNELLHSNGLTQHIEEATHIKGHTLDVLISRDSCTIINNIEVFDACLCDNDGNNIKDHYAIKCTIHHTIDVPNRKLISYRNLKDIDVEQFKKDIQISGSLNDLSGTLDDLAERYNSGLLMLVNAHAPVIEKMVTIRSHAPWYTGELLECKRQRRNLERKWQRSQDQADYLKYRKLCCNVARKLDSAKTYYYSKKITECGNDTKLLFNITNKLLLKKQNMNPTSENPGEMANKFNNFFVDKIENLRENFIIEGNTDEDLRPLTHVKFSNLRPATPDEVTQLIKCYSNKSCLLDPLPTWLLKQCVTVLLPLIMSIVNTSLETGQFPECFRDAIVIPHIKKPNLDCNELKHYRPVSNLPFLSKVLEKVVVRRLEEHMQSNRLYDPLQSAYKVQHSTETAVLKIYNDVISSIDRGKCTVLASIDSSAAFDTVDHSTFVSRLKYLYGVDGEALNWFKSYLNSRRQRVSIDNVNSDYHLIKYGVPQGSVLGARLYTLYTYPLSNIIADHGLCYHCYADDTQIYMECENDTNSIQNVITCIQNCVADICTWMMKNSLKINEDKTEFIVFRNRLNQTGNDFSLQINGSIIPAVNSTKILGVTLDAKMTLDNHISNTCKATYMHIRRINSIRKYLSTHAVKTLVQSLVISRLDYCNSIYTGLALKSIHKLQLAQNAAARCITRTPRRDHMTPVLRELHWLPMSKRCQFKTLMLTYKSLHENAPSYICELLNWYTPRRSLRSASTTSLVPNRNKTVKYSKRLLDTAAANLWNGLPSDLKTAANISCFKGLLKTYLFNI